jgi:hypothetical protein
MDSRHRTHSTPTRARRARTSRRDLQKIDHRQKLIDPITRVARRLMYVRATAVTVELALRAQNGDQDADVADCMRAGICDSLDDQVTQLMAIVESLGETPTVQSRENERV